MGERKEEGYECNKQTKKYMSMNPFGVSVNLLEV